MFSDEPSRLLNVLDVISKSCCSIPFRFLAESQGEDDKLTSQRGILRTTINES